MSSTLILLRHGQSAWNAENRFTGWVDVALSNQGSQEAVRSGEQLQAVGLLPDVVHTSVLRRAITTANLLLDEVGRHWIPVRRTWRLNERHYGALQGKKKEQVLAEFGADQYMQWRRSYDVPPPPIGEDERAAQMQDPRYAGLGASFPAGECLRDVLERVLPHWEDLIATDLHNGSTVLVVAHGNAIRALIKYLDRLSDEEVVGLNVPTGMPLVFELSDDLVPIVPHGRYLDPARAATAAAAVAREGT